MSDGDAARTLAGRAAAQASLGDPGGIAELLRALREAGAGNAARTLVDWAANAGMLDLSLEVQPDEAPNYLFGREPDGTPSQPWRWEEPGQLGPWSAEATLPSADCRLPNSQVKSGQRPVRMSGANVKLRSPRQRPAPRNLRLDRTVKVDPSLAHRQSRASATGMPGLPRQLAARVRWKPGLGSGPASESSRSGFVLLNNARRDAPTLTDRDALVFRPRPDAAAALAA